MDHQTLATLLLHFSRSFSALIDLDGVPICPPGISPLAPWPEQRDWVNERFSRLPGKKHEVPYIAASGLLCATYVVDFEFLDAWLDAPDFRMVK